ncbi:MAG: hypothetical protein HY232_17075 [Acidobacteria bacterium]|nr:hypothetical protein [Acidobacteriota bacterium]
MQRLKLYLILSLLLLIMQQNNIAAVFSHIPCKNVFFLNSKVGWIVGDDGLFKTNDGGTTWMSLNEYLLPLGSESKTTPYALNDGFFIDENVGWIISKRKILKTSNGGLSWIDQTPSIQYSAPLQRPDEEFLKIKFVNANHGWVLGNSPHQPPIGMSNLGTPLFLMSSDGGRSWNRADLKDIGRYSNFQFLDEKNGWLVRYDGILETQNSGYKWTLRKSIKQTSLNDLIFLDKNNGWLVGWRGKILHTHNGGNSWLVEDLGENYLFSKVFFITPEIGWIVGNLKKKDEPSEALLLATKDGGKSWKVQYKEVGKVLLPFFSNAQEGWLVVNKSLILHETNEYKILFTSNGGKSWTLLFNSK